MVQGGGGCWTVVPDRGLRARAKVPGRGLRAGGGAGGRGAGAGGRGTGAGGIGRTAGASVFIFSNVTDSCPPVKSTLVTVYCIC